MATGTREDEAAEGTTEAEAIVEAEVVIIAVVTRTRGIVAERMAMADVIRFRKRSWIESEYPDPAHGTHD